MKSNKNKSLCKLFGIRYPIIQAGMVWVSGGKLAAAAANAGILGIIGAGSMTPDILREQIQKAKSLTNKPLAVNVPLLYSGAKQQIDIALAEKINIFFTSAGDPKKFTAYLKENGCTVVHVTSSPKLAVKCQNAGVDAVVAEGFEAGGHNGKEEITSLVLIPQVCQAVSIPVIAAGGIVSGATIAAAFVLGASGVQMGTRFVATQESRAHPHFKEAIVKSKSDATALTLKKLVPVRLMKNKFFQDVQKLSDEGASVEKLKELQGIGRAKRGMHEGDLDEGKLEIGQACAMISEIPSVQECVESLLTEYHQAIEIFQ